MGFLIVAIILTATGVIWAIFSAKSDEYGCSSVGSFIIITISTVVLVVISGFMIANSISEFQYRYEQEREYLVEAYNVYYEEYSDDLAHQQSLKEIRKEIAEFNAKIHRNNEWNKNFFTKWLVANCEDIPIINISNGIAS